MFGSLAILELLLAGYIVVGFVSRFKYRAAKLEITRLGFESFAVGIAIFACASLLQPLIHPSIQILTRRLPALDAWPLSPSGTLAILIAIILTLLLNWRNPGTSSQLAWATRNTQGFHATAIAAYADQTLVSATLDNRKVYVGWVVDAPSCLHYDPYLVLWPVASGYRDKDTLDLILNRWYEEDDQQPDPDPLQVVLHAKDIRIFGKFSYQHYQGLAEPDASTAPTPPDSDSTTLPATPASSSPSDSTQTAHHSDGSDNAPLPQVPLPHPPA